MNYDRIRVLAGYKDIGHNLLFYVIMFSHVLFVVAANNVVLSRLKSHATSNLTFQWLVGKVLMGLVSGAGLVIYHFIASMTLTTP